MEDFQRAVALANQQVDEKGRIQRTSLDKKCKNLIESFSLPLVDPKYEEMIGRYLGVEELSQRDLIVAVLSSLFSPIRQRIGSCFATAPAIIVHEEQPLQYLQDLKDLLYTGRLTRVVAGTQYTVPISPTAGPYDDHPLQKIWEYTIASFVDGKTEFSRWNLYESLGLHHEEEGGIGQLLYTHLAQKLEENNQELQKTQQDYEIAYDQLRLVERQLQSASSESEIRRLQAEQKARGYHFTTVEHQRNFLSKQSEQIAHFFTFVMDQMIELFQEQFQEVFDAHLQDPSFTQYDDAPAGFRLLYKHGRSHVRSWTFIYDEQGFVDALKEFFRFTEHPIREACEWEEGKEEISHFITRIIHHVATEEFLQSAYRRMAKAHTSGTPKPWAYTSGGTLTTLMKTYFKRDADFTVEGRWMQSAQDLSIFLLETLKSLPPTVTNAFASHPHKRMLMTSPTHVFSLLPGLGLFRKGWEDPGFTYTFLRDRFLLPSRAFYKKINLSPEEQHVVLDALGQVARTSLPLTLAEFRLQLPADPEIDAQLFSLLPLASKRQAEALFTHLGVKPPALSPWTTRWQLFSLLAAHVSPDQVVSAMQRHTLSPPQPLFFADTNWPGLYFSFVVHPVTLELELWRTDPLGLTGAPMSDWVPYLNGTVKTPWQLFIHPHEYVLQA